VHDVVAVLGGAWQQCNGNGTRCALHMSADEEYL
jgi:hypothetical protein